MKRLIIYLAVTFGLTWGLQIPAGIALGAFENGEGSSTLILALLDDSDTGFVLNAVHSKENCFLYIKEIMKGESYIMLSNEEIEALRIAKRYGNDELLDE